MEKTRVLIEKALEKGNGILRLRPAWVARDFLPPGKRLGLKEEEYEAGERGWVSERWLASTTSADNRIGPEDEGLSYIDLDDGNKIILRDAVSYAGDLIMGKKYAKNHNGLGRLAKIYDFADRIPYHIHQMKKDAELVGANPKEEAYFFLENIDTGAHPETFFGVHPYIVEQKKYDLLLPYLEDWNSNLILKHARAYLNAPGEGFHLPAGILHAPGTALTLELQEDSDVFAFLQALVAGKIISKDLLYKDVSKENRERYKERAVLNQIDWKSCGDPYFYENHHLEPKLVKESEQEGGYEQWIYYNTTKFSGKKVKVRPGCSFSTSEKGVYNIFVWKGSGTFDGHKIEKGNFKCDELLVSYEKAIKPLLIENTGTEDLELIKFFGPDINIDIPMIEKHE